MAAITWQISERGIAREYLPGLECDGCGAELHSHYYWALIEGDGRFVCGQPCAQIVHDDPHGDARAIERERAHRSAERAQRSAR